MAAPKHELYVARTSGSAEIAGELFVFTAEVTRVRAGHPLLDAVPDYFVPMDEKVHYDVEAATAKPGEKRS